MSQKKRKLEQQDTVSTIESHEKKKHKVEEEIKTLTFGIDGLKSVRKKQFKETAQYESKQ